MKNPTWCLRAILLALALGSADAAQETLPRSSSLASRLANWKLNATTGVPGPLAMEELEELIQAAEAGSNADLAAQGKALLAQYAAQSEEDGASIAERLGDFHLRIDDLRFQGAVQAALDRGDSNFLSLLGDHAVPALTSLALQSDGLPAKRGSITPLRWLNRSAPKASLPVVVSLLKSENPLVRERAFQTAARAFGIEKSSGIWIPEGALGWRLADPTWAAILEQAVEEPGLSHETLGTLISAFANKGLLDRSAGDVALRLADSGLLTSDGPVVAPQGLWLWKRLLEEGNLVARNEAAVYLLTSPYRDLSYGAARDDLETTQLVLAGGLLMGYRARWADEQRSDTIYDPYVPVPSKELGDAFGALVTSKFPKVASAAIKNAGKRIEETGSLPFGGEALLGFIQGARSPGLKWDLIRLIKGIPKSERVATLTAAVEHTAPLTEDSERFSRVLSILRRLPQRYGIPGSQAFWTVAHLMGPYLRITDDRRQRWFSELIDDLVANGSVDPGPMLDWLESHGLDVKWFIRKQGVPEPTRHDWIDGLSTEARLRLIVQLSPRLLRDEDTERLIRDGYLTGPASLLYAVGDPRSSSTVKVATAEYLLSKTAAPLPGDLLPEVAMAYPHVRPNHVNGGRYFLPHMNAEQRATAFSSWVADPSVPDTFLLQLHPVIQDEATMSAIMRRFPRSEWAQLEVDPPSLLEAAVTFAVSRSVETLHPLLVGDLAEAARVYAWIAFEIKNHRSEVLQPVAMEILSQTRSGPPWAQAVQAVAGYYNASAAAALLEAAKRNPSETDRRVAMEALREITEWREAARTWSRAADAEVQRADAIAALAELIEAPSQSVEVRAASIRGLGLLAAAEELPLIIQGLSSKEPKILAAARAALLRLEQEADR